MRFIRPIVLATVVLAPASLSFAQGAPPAKTAATAKPSAAPAAPAKPSAAASAPQAAGAGASAAHEISTDVDAAMNEKAQALFKEGNSFFRDGKYPQAQAAYKAAWALELRSQRIVRNLGSTELELKMYRDAAEHLTIALRLAAPTDPRRAAIEKDVAEARAKVGTIRIQVKGGGQELDGVEVVQMETGRAYQLPLADPIFVEAGKASFRIRREGYESQEKVFELKAGEETAADIELSRAAGFGAATSSATPTASSTAPVSPGGGRNKLPGWIAAGVGVAAAAVGGALVGVASSTGSDIHNNVPRLANGEPACGRSATAGEDAVCADFRSKAASASTMGNAGVGLLIGGGIVAAAGLVYVFLPIGKPDQKSAKWIPVVSPEGGGLVFTGSF